MILQEKAQFLVGTSGSNIMKVMNETGGKYKVIVMNEGALSDDLMDATNFNRYAFMPSASTEQIGRGLAYYYGQIRKKEEINSISSARIIHLVTGWATDLRKA